ncbi:MAG: NAD(P)/FAD-dependent oxidoreductase, partial [Bythopirellula sp.]
GGGMMGLTLAYRLAQQGQRVTLLEAGSSIGGLADAWELGGVTWDRHYHVTLLSDLHLRQLLSELELEESMRWVETKTGFFTDGKLYSMSNSFEFLKFPPLNLIEKFRLGFTIFAASKIKNWKTLEQRFVADWLRQWSGEGTFQKIWLPLLQAKLGPTYKQVSAAFIWATIARMYRARQSGLKKEMFGYVPGGYARVLATFGEKLASLGVAIKTSQAVQQVVSEMDGRVRVTCSENDSQVFDRVVLTTPSPLIPKLCPQLPERERIRHQQIEYLGILCASVVLKRPLANYYVTNITDSWVPFTAVIEMTTLVDPSELGGQYLAYLPRYVDADDPAWQWSDAELEEKFISALERMYPDFSRDEVLAFRVSRVKRVMALPTLRYSQNLPSIDTSIENVFAVNSAQIVKGTLNVNEVIEIAEDALRDHLLPAIHADSPPQKNVEATGELVARS